MMPVSNNGWINVEKKNKGFHCVSGKARGGGLNSNVGKLFCCVRRWILSRIKSQNNYTENIKAKRTKFKQFENRLHSTSYHHITSYTIVKRSRRNEYRTSKLAGGLTVTVYVTGMMLGYLGTG